MNNKTPFKTLDFRCGWILRRKRKPDDTILVLQVTPNYVYFIDEVKWGELDIASHAHTLEYSKDGGETWLEPFKE